MQWKDGVHKPNTLAVLAAWPIALLLAVASLGGLLSNAYSHELPAWQAQAIGQDWFDLVIAVPAIAICGLRARHGSYRWSVLLAGTYAYTVYELVIYSFAVHFNALFLVYCATLGLAGYALISLVLDLSRRVQHVDRSVTHFAGGFLIAVGVVFGLMWLAEDVPAILRGTTPQSLVETGLYTNPVHVLDLAFVLPAHVIAGWWLWRRHPDGELFAPIVLAFGVLMAASIGGMLVVMRGPVGVIAAMFVTAGLSAAVLARVLRHAPVVTPSRTATARPVLASHRPS